MFKLLYCLYHFCISAGSQCVPLIYKKLNPDLANPTAPTVLQGPRGRDPRVLRHDAQGHRHARAPCGRRGECVGALVLAAPWGCAPPPCPTSLTPTASAARPRTPQPTASAHAHAHVQAWAGPRTRPHTPTASAARPRAPPARPGPLLSVHTRAPTSERPHPCTNTRPHQCRWSTASRSTGSEPTAPTACCRCTARPTQAPACLRTTRPSRTARACTRPQTTPRSWTTWCVTVPVWVGGWGVGRGGPRVGEGGGWGEIGLRWAGFGCSWALTVAWRVD